MVDNTPETAAPAEKKCYGCHQCGGRLTPTTDSVIATYANGTQVEVLKGTLRCVECDEQDTALKEELAAARGEINAMRDCFECHICQVHNP